MIFKISTKPRTLGTMSLALVASANLLVAGSPSPGPGKAMAGLNASPGGSEAGTAAGSRRPGGTFTESVTAGPISTGPTLAIVSRADEELLLFQLRLSQRSLSDSFPAFPLPGGVVVPLGEITRLLE